MVQVAHPLVNTKISVCDGCSGKPVHVEVRGRIRHFIECCRCRIQTEEFPTVLEAMTAWEHGHTRPTKEA